MLYSNTKNLVHIFSDNRFILILLFLFSLIIRLLFINAGLFHHDSVQLAIATEETVKTFELHAAVGGKLVLVLINSLIFLIPYYFLKVTSAEFTITLTSIFFAALSICFLYLFLRELTNKVFISFASSILFSVTPIYLSVTTYAKSHSLSIFFVLLAAYTLIKSTKENSKKLGFISGLSLGILLFIRPSDFLFIIPFIFLFLYAHKIIKLENSKARFKVNFLYLIVLPLLLISLLYGITQFSVIVSQIKSNPLVFDKIVLLSSIVSLINTTTIIGFLFLLIGLYYLFIKNRYLLAFFLFWFFTTYIYYSNVFTFAQRFLILSLIPIMILVGYGLEFFYIKNKIIAFIILILIASSMFLSIYPIIKYRHVHSGGKDLALFVNNLTENNSVVIIGDDGPFLDYYGYRRTIAYPATNNKELLDNFIEKVNDILDSNINVYIPETNYIYHHPPKESKMVYDLINENFNVTVVGEIIWENYHHASILSQKFDVYLFKLDKNS